MHSTRRTICLFLIEFATAVAFTTALGASSSMAQGLSPANWPKADRENLELLESTTFSPKEACAVEGRGGIVSATVSPLSAYAGIRALKAGGNAADAAATVALTQVTMQLGSVVSYAGVFTCLYYDAHEHRVYSMDAGYNSYLQETDPKSIPIADLGPLAATGSKPDAAGALGRQTLVPGFMAGIEAMHARFGRLAFKNLFGPAVWYAEHGVRLSPIHQYFFSIRGPLLARTEEGRAFVRQSGSDSPKAGDLFVQLELAKTLDAVRTHGSQYLYTGLWAQDFVRIVRREGGRVTAEDLRRYQPIWSEPYKEDIFGHTVYVNGPPQMGVHGLFTGLNLAEALKLDVKGPYWSDPETFRGLARIAYIAAVAPSIGMRAAGMLRQIGVDISPRAQLTKDYASKLAPYLDQIFTAPAAIDPRHSNAIVVVDREGNIAVVTHTINAVIWGGGGIVVGGIPIPDSAGFQQPVLAMITPGDRVPHQIIDTISFDGNQPVLATASIGSSLIPESIRVLFGILGQHQPLGTVLRAPPLLLNVGVSVIERPAWQLPVPIPKDAYSPDFIARLRKMGMTLDEIAPERISSLRGTLAAVSLDPATGQRSAVNEPSLFVFNAAEP